MNHTDIWGLSGRSPKTIDRGTKVRTLSSVPRLRHDNTAATPYVTAKDRSHTILHESIHPEWQKLASRGIVTDYRENTVCYLKYRQLKANRVWLCLGLFNGILTMSPSNGFSRRLQILCSNAVIRCSRKSFCAEGCSINWIMFSASSKVIL